MSEENKAIVRRDFEEVWNNKNLAVIDELYASDHIRHGLVGESGNAGYRQFVTMYLDAFPDVRFTVEDLIAEGDRVAVRWSATGTHKGDLPNIPATDKQVAVVGNNVVKVNNGKIVEEWGTWDALGLMKQLGVIPED